MPPVSPSEISRLLNGRFTGNVTLPGKASSRPDACETMQIVRPKESQRVVIRRIVEILDDQTTMFVRAKCAEGSIKSYEVHRCHMPGGESVRLHEAS